MRITLLLMLVIPVTVCNSDRNGHMAKQEHQLTETRYDSLQEIYRQMMATYEQEEKSMPEELAEMYTGMQQMRGKMEDQHRQMMNRSMRGRMKNRPMGEHMKNGNMMSEKMGMQWQGHMEGEWYQQMMGMHEQMAEMHRKRGQQSMAEMNRKLSGKFKEMREAVPDLNEPAEAPPDENRDLSQLNGKELYSGNCASCHGRIAEGIPGAFPPLVNTKWITGDKSVPIRTILHGLEGELEVKNQAYDGSMPSFRARLSNAEIAAIINYLRSESEGDQSLITQEDVAQLRDQYSDRTNMWNSSELEEVIR